YDRLEPVPEFAPTPVPTLTSREIGFDQSLYKKLDVNGDGRLDGAELKGLSQRLEPDVDLAIRIGTRGNGQPGVEVLNRNDAAGIAVAGSPGTNGVSFVMGQNELQIAAAGDDTNAEQFYLERFKQADADNNGYLEPAEVNANPVFENAFAEIDADNDQRLFPQELTAYVAERTSAAASRIVLTALVEGHNLFDILDVNGDGRLGRREFALAAARLDAWDANRDGELEQDEIPEHFRLELSRANPGLPGLPRAAVNRPRTRETQPIAPSGPTWFQKMDRNQDGDVSQREFLGPASAFERLDTNHDELLDATEAAK
ncbi:MAG: hypothetical protein WD648_05100, partial [Planctomycetaceae bacterium]